jgi:hypothetical protein
MNRTTQLSNNRPTECGIHPKRTPFRIPTSAFRLRHAPPLLSLAWLPLLFFQTPPGSIPNPFCNAFAIGLTWVGGIVGLAVLIFGAQLVARHFLGRAGGDMTTGALAIVGGLFVLGLLSNDGAGLVMVAQGLGFEGFTLGCSATPAGL